MKKIYSFIAIFIACIGFAQIPANYYSTATGTGYPLKTQLYNIIKTHTTLSYTPGLWNLYPSSDAKPAPNSAQVWDTYSNCNMLFGTVASGGNQDNGTAGSNPCERFNREHTMPKSWFGGISALPMATDAFIVMPTDKKINGLRSSYCYGIVGTNTISASVMAYTTCKLGDNVAPNCPVGMTVFEPADEFKGDFARNYFYMATCYENLIASWQNIDPNGAKFFDGTNTTCYQSWALNMLYQWHLTDPVSQKEIDRNNVIYYNANGQGNRNPFIDHPEWVQAIWSANLATNTFDIATTAINVYPNPSNDHRINIDSEAILDQIELINVNGQLMQQIKNPVSQNHTYTLENLSQGFYFLKLRSNDKTIIKKVVIN
jgi:endonuclease I